MSKTKSKKQTDRKKAFKKLFIRTAIYLGIAAVLFIVGMILQPKIWRVILKLLAVGFVVIAFFVFKEGFVHIRNITCPLCGKMYNYKRDVRVSYLGTDRTIEVGDYGAKTSSLKAKFKLRCYCNVDGFKTDFVLTHEMLGSNYDSEDISNLFDYYFNCY